MSLIVRHWRAWLAFAALGSAVAFCYRGDWAWAALAGVLAALPPARWVRGQMADTRATLRAFAKATAIARSLTPPSPRRRPHPEC